MFGLLGWSFGRSYPHIFPIKPYRVGGYTGICKRGSLVERCNPWLLLVIYRLPSIVAWCFRSLCLKKRIPYPHGYKFLMSYGLDPISWTGFVRVAGYNFTLLDDHTLNALLICGRGVKLGGGDDITPYFVPFLYCAFIFKKSLFWCTFNKLY